MDALRAVVEELEREEDDVLRTLPLVSGNPGLTEALFGRLVDVMLQRLFVELRRRYEQGDLTSHQYALETYRLEHQCREVGLDAPPAADAESSA